MMAASLASTDACQFDNVLASIFLCSTYYLLVLCLRTLPTSSPPLPPTPAPFSQSNPAHRETLKTTKPYSGRKRSLAGQKQKRERKEKRKMSGLDPWYQLCCLPTSTNSTTLTPTSRQPPTSLLLLLLLWLLLVYSCSTQCIFNLQL